MKIDRKDIKKYCNLLSKIPYMPVQIGKPSVIAAPISNEKTTEISGMDLVLKDTITAYRSTDPMLIFNSDAQHPVVFAYGNTTYGVKFDIIEYCDLIDYKLSKSEIELLKPIDFYLLNTDYIELSVKF